MYVSSYVCKLQHNLCKLTNFNLLYVKGKAGAKNQRIPEYAVVDKSKKKKMDDKQQKVLYLYLYN